MAEQKKGASTAAQHTPKDKHGNPEGTTYTEQGKANPLDMGLNDLPEGPVYNEDGSVFIVPADAEKVKATYRADITSLRIAIDKGNGMIAAAKEMAAEADAEDKPIFEKKINSQQVAVASNEAAMAELKAKLQEYEISLITPAQRADQRLLTKLIAEHAEVTARLLAHQNKMKVYSVPGVDKAEVKAASKDHKDATPEQIAFKEAAITKYGTQGAAIQAWTKEGWTIKEITEKTGIPSPNIVGPRNVWIRSVEGAAYENVEGRMKLKA